MTKYIFIIIQILSSNSRKNNFNIFYYALVKFEVLMLTDSFHCYMTPHYGMACVLTNALLDDVILGHHLQYVGVVTKWVYANILLLRGERIFSTDVSNDMQVLNWKTKGGLSKQKTQAHRQAGPARKHDLLSIVDIDLGLGLPVDTINGGKWPFGHTDCH